MTHNVEYLSQSVDYLGFLRTKLRDLSGISALVYELIQNADDVKGEQGNPGASRISFDVRDDALIVENDGVFRERDFKRMQTIASGNKREEVGTTGSYGIGFISVYQVTDRPEIHSSGRRWSIRPDAPEKERIQQENGLDTKGTLFKLPWATDPNSLTRIQLGYPEVTQSQLDDFVLKIRDALPLAALFLKRLTTLELMRSGQHILKITRQVVEGDCLFIAGDGTDRLWRLYRGNFDAQAQRLREQFPYQIEAKRHSNVVLAIPDILLKQGRLFATLPTEMGIPLPFHINADFYPYSDRKRVIFEQGFASDWNRAAIQTAAQIVSQNVVTLRELVGYKGLWQLIQRLKECKLEVDKKELDVSFGLFWDEIAGQLSTSSITFTAQKQWVKPSMARLLEGDAEIDSALVFIPLGIQSVHPDLREHFGLMRQREIGTPLLSIDDIVAALKQHGLSNTIPISHVPVFLQKPDNLRLFWSACQAILNRTQQRETDRDKARSALAACAIAPDSLGNLCQPSMIFRTDNDQTRQLYVVPWLSKEFESIELLRQLTPEFSVIDALGYLSSRHSELESEWKAGHQYIRNVIQWFADHKREIVTWVDRKKKLSDLPIWPAADRLRPLSELYIPGGFDDPLELSDLVDMKVLAGHRDFLKELGAKELTFQTYVQHEVPRVLAQPSIPIEVKRKLVQLLASKLGEIQGNSQLKDQLSQLPLVECTDGNFRRASDVYFQSEVLVILGAQVSTALLPSSNREAVTSLYQWLGVCSEPRSEHVVSYIKSIVAIPCNSEARDKIVKIFGYLIDLCRKYQKDDLERNYSDLRQIAWLPGVKKTTQWYRPSHDQLYASFDKHLFASQAAFLDIPYQLQRDAAATEGLFDFLKIKRSPSVLQVVEHLLLCCEQNKPVHNQTYLSLAQNANDPSVLRLLEKSWLLLPNDHYVRSNQVFWRSHPFGTLRYQLADDMVAYKPLFDRLGVRDVPDAKDYVDVLLEISERYGASNIPMDEDDSQAELIAIQCWQALSSMLDSESTQPEQANVSSFTSLQLERLKGKKVIPDPRHMLAKPEMIFFEDRAGLASKFEVLEYNIIKRTPGAWKAMEEVGVQRLSVAMQVELIESDDIAIDECMMKRMDERRSLINRVVESNRDSAEDINAQALDGLTFCMAKQLLVRYSINFVRHLEAPPEEVQILYQADKHQIITIPGNGDRLWPEIARELAFAFRPGGDVGNLASGINVALSTSSLEQADRTLDALGFPPQQAASSSSVVEAEPVKDFGGTTENGPQYTSGEDAAAAILGGQIQRTPMPPTPTETAGRGEGSNLNLGDQIVSPTPGDANVKPTEEQSPFEQVNKRRPKGRKRTYVVPENKEVALEPNSDLAEHNNRVDQAGISRVLAFEESQNRAPEAQEHFNVGYDVESKDEQGNVRFIEVKSLSNEWCEPNPAALSNAQFDFAQTHADQFWLYVVEYAEDDRRFHIYMIHNPVTSVDQFLFDDGWRYYALEHSATDITKLRQESSAIS